jgi:lipopolysaccharide/colanic/teichoic acid biosynthesis glycosyltransferase
MMYSGTGIECSPYIHSTAKRCFDVIVCLLVLVPGAVITVTAALALLIVQGRPVIFVQRRAGINGRLFRMPKLRTLSADANPYEPSFRHGHGGSVTRVGSFLRRHRLDELPQLVSVLRGDMSMVGPRPELPNIVAEYEPVHKLRLLARPGLTGLWQLMGSRSAAMHEDMVYDNYYICKGSLWVDIQVLVLTVGFMFRPD